MPASHSLLALPPPLLLVTSHTLLGNTHPTSEDIKALAPPTADNSTMESNTSTATLPDIEMADQANIIKSPPALFMTYFDDPTRSDITIVLSDRSVHAHGIVLCRGSEYFSNLLAESSQVRICRIVVIAPY